MSAPVPHHLSAGIHPGAFVQPDEPITTDVQDGVLWVDTSRPAPYALKCWDAEAGLWRLVGPFDGYGLVFAEGESIYLSPTTLLIQTVDPDDFTSRINQIAADHTTLILYAGGIQRLILPLPGMNTQPRMLLAQEPDLGVPALCHAALASPEQLLTPVPVPAATTITCTHMRCGVSLNCTNHLVSLYDNWARWLNPLFAVSGALAFAALLEELGGAIIGAEVAESTAAIWTQLKPLLQGAFGVLTGNLLPLLIPDTRNDVQKMLFCALNCAGGVVTLSPTEIAAWHAAQVAYGGWAAVSLQGELVQLLTQYTPLQDWLTAASTATATSACDLWTCP